MNEKSYWVIGCARIYLSGVKRIAHNSFQIKMYNDMLDYNQYKITYGMKYGL